VADNQKSEAFVPHFFQFPLNLNQQRHVFLDAEPAYKSENMVAIIGLSLPFPWGEQFCIDAARHQVARSLCGPFQQGAQLRLGAKRTFAIE